jgi:hypothetical protein
MARGNPSYCKQKRNDGPDLAYVTLDGKRYYLGEYGCKESKERYARLMAEWHAGYDPLPLRGSDLKIVNLLAAYLRHAKAYYVHAERYCQKLWIRS